MSLVLKFKEKIEEKIRYIEASTTSSLLAQDQYAMNVGHVTGLVDALTILNQVLGEMAEPEDRPNGGEDDEGYQ